MLQDDFKDYILYEKNTPIIKIKYYNEEPTHYHIIADWIGTYSNRISFMGFDGSFIIQKNSLNNFRLLKRKEKVEKIKNKIKEKIHGIIK